MLDEEGRTRLKLKVCGGPEGRTLASCENTIREPPKHPFNVAMCQIRPLPVSRQEPFSIENNIIPAIPLSNLTGHVTVTITSIARPPGFRELEGFEEGGIV